MTQIIDTTAKTTVAMKNRLIKTPLITPPSDIEVKLTDQGQGTGRELFVVLTSNRKRMLSQNETAKPGTINAMKSKGVKPAAMPTAQSASPFIKPGSSSRFMLSQAM